MKSSSGDTQHLWSFLTNHAHVLACIANDPNARLRDVAETVGITERTTVQIVSQLEVAGYLTKTRVGRRNQYKVHTNLRLRHPRQSHLTVEQLIAFLHASAPEDGDGSAPRKRPD
jgi:predicted transcriptional regulator of viral defense system